MGAQHFHSFGGISLHGPYRTGLDGGHIHDQATRMHARSHRLDHLDRFLYENADQNDVTFFHLLYHVMGIAHTQPLRDLYLPARTPDRDIKSFSLKITGEP